MPDYYSQQSELTDPGEYAHLYDGLPTSVSALCEIIQGLLVHWDSVELHGGADDKTVSTGHLRVKDLLDRIVALDPRPLHVSREVNKRERVICRDFSLLLCSVLRHKKIPTRARCGYAVYLTDPSRDDVDFVYDHWLCEYWNGERWILVDAELDEFELKTYTREDIAPLDVDRGSFINAADAWKGFREGRYTEEYFGEPESSFHGVKLLRAQLLLDFACLNKRELKYDSIMHQTSESELLLLDHVAELLLEPDSNFDRIRELYRSETGFEDIYYNHN